MEFDSDNPPAQISEAVSAYAAMKGNGFSFWIGSDNRIVSVEGFKEFLEGCLRNVPEHHRANVMQFIEAGAGEGGISNFVDNSIGLLPYGNHTEVGEEWQREDHVGKPVPLHVRSKYTLKELTHDYAVVDIHGVIDPSTSVHALDRTQGGARVSVMGGTVTGACTLYRESGLPKESRVVRAMDMVVQLSSGPQFRQSKTIVTTIESYPSSNTANSRIRDKVQPVSGTFDSEQPPPRNQRR